MKLIILRILSAVFLITTLISFVLGQKTFLVLSIFLAGVCGFGGELILQSEKKHK